MKFHIKHTGHLEQRQLSYNSEECSFDVEPNVQKINFDIVINKLNLTVDEENKVIQIWGFCGYKEWIDSNYDVPKYKMGILKVLDDLESGVGSYIVNKKDFPIYINKMTGWVCIGDPKEHGEAVEFIKNCVAVIDKEGNFISLWLKPIWK